MITPAALNGVQVEVLFLDEAASIMSLKNCKEAGHIKFSVCPDSVGYFGLPVEELNPGMDDVRQAKTIWNEEVSEADRVLKF